MKKYIFREYDVRGIYPTDLNEEDAYRMAYFHFYLTRAYYVQAMKKDNYM